MGYIPPVVAERPQPEDQLNYEAEAGHSHHGEAFNEGPRQSAYLMGGTGNVHFPITTSHPDAQKFFDQGVGQLHGYWYYEAERSFRQVAMLDHDCAMAYWGMAKANVNNSKRAEAFIRQARKRIDSVSERERLYIEALDASLAEKNADVKAKKYAKAMKQIIDAYPDDLEALAEYAHHIYQNRARLKLDYPDVEKVLNEVLARNPMHPAHHFIIHLWDAKDAKNALKSSALCGQSAPGIAHMWHMPGHIYSRLKRYEDAVWQQEASARVDHAHMMRDYVLPDQIHNFAHNNEWLIRNMVFIGRHKDAMALAQNMIDLPRHPTYNTLTNRKSNYYGRLRLFEVLAQFELWEETIALCHSSYLPATEDKAEQQKRLQALGIAYARTGQMEKAEAILAELDKEIAPLKEKVAEEKQKQKEAEEKAKAEGKKTPRANATPTSTSLKNLEKVVAAIQGHQRIQKGEFKEALPLLNTAGENKSVIAWVQAKAGETEAAIKAARAQVKSGENQVLPLAYLVDILWQAGQQEEAKESFQELRILSGSLQLGAAPFDRLAPVAEALQLEPDWRIAYAPASDVGERPTLDSLGPFRWQPSPAPEWSLPDSTGKQYASRECHGKPMVVFFYLGFGCLHCAEQIQAVIPKKAEFEKAGIDVFAISTEDAETMKIALENFDKGKVSFPLLTDPELNVFKAWRVYDDFEKTPLHGTFLIDAESRVLWQDISHEPFMKLDFLLEEAQRLLNNQKFQLPTPDGAVPVTSR